MSHKFLLNLTIAASALLIPQMIFSQNKPDISHDEVKSKKVEFINRTARPASREVRLREVKLGEELSKPVLAGENDALINGVAIKRVFQADLEGFGADILIVNPQANFGHINAIHRVLSGYIARSFEYDLDQADTLARYILYYNANHRNDLKTVEQKYSEDVIAALDKTKIGIDRSYQNWSGKTQILIPLRKNLVRPNGTDLNNGELEKTVGEDGTKEEQKELEKIQDERKEEDLKKLDEKEKELTKEETALKQEEKKIVQEEKKTDTEIKKTDEKITELQKDPVKNADQIKKEEAKKEDLTKKQQDTAKKKETVKTEQAKVQKQKQEVAAQKQETKGTAGTDAAKPTETAAKVEKLEQENQQLKEEIKAKEEKSENVVGEKILFMRVMQTTENSHYQSELWSIDTLNDDALFRSPYLNICGREFTVIPDQGILVIGYPGEAAHTSEHRLVLLDPASLTLKKEGTDVVYFRTPVKLMDGKIYTVAIHESMYYLTRFNPDLTLDARSENPISSDSEITFTKDKIYLTGKKTNGATKISVFKRTDLTHIKTFEPVETRTGAANVN